MFKVGDKVVVTDVTVHARRQIGDAGEIVRIFADSDYSHLYFVKFEDGICDVMAFSENEIALLEDATEPEPVYKDNNPKTAVGALKIPLHLVPPSATHYLAQAFADGAAKYGPYNWRSAPVSASTYYGAARRHEDAWWDGENVASDSLRHHLAHAMACYAIILDALEAGTLVDDRPTKGTASVMQAGWLDDGRKG